MTKMWITVGLVLAIIGSAAGWKHSYDKARRAEGARVVLLAQNDSLQQVIDSTVAKVDTVFREKVVTLNKVITKFDTLLKIVTNNTRDTVTVREFITVADSVRQACEAAIQGCQVLVASLRQSNDNLRSRINILEPQVCKPAGFLRNAFNIGRLVVDGFGVWKIAEVVR